MNRACHFFCFFAWNMMAKKPHRNCLHWAAKNGAIKLRAAKNGKLKGTKDGRIYIKWQVPPYFFREGSTYDDLTYALWMEKRRPAADFSCHFSGQRQRTYTYIYTYEFNRMNSDIWMMMTNFVKENKKETLRVIDHKRQFPGHFINSTFDSGVI